MSNTSVSSFRGASGSHSLLGGASAGSLTSHSLLGGASAGSLTSHSLLGGASAGSLTSRSLQGGASSMAGVYNYVPGTSTLGFWIKFPSRPGLASIIFDFNGGASGYNRVALDTDGKLIFEWSYGGGSSSNKSVNVLATGTWYWVTWRNGAPGGGVLNSDWFIYGPGAVLIENTITSNITSTGPTFSVQFGLGVPLSAAYAPWPNTTGFQLSKILVNNTGTISPPTADRTTDNDDWNCRDSLGTQTTLLDAGAAPVNLTAGSQGLTIVSDGPYAT